MYFRSIQFLRFFAAVYVTLFHILYWWNQQQDAFTGLLDNGHAAVDLFFVISGFVILQSALNFRTGWYPFLVFLKKRLIRIYPMYWVILAFFVVTGIVDTSTRTSWQIAQAVFLLPLHGGLIGPSWTLQWELYFYVLSSLLVLNRRFKYLLWMLMVLAIARITLLLLPFYHLPDIALYNHYVAEFFLGMLAFTLHDKMRSGVAVMLSAIGLFFFLSPPQSPISNAFLFGLPAALLTTGVTALEKQGTIKVPLALARLGDASYCLYLIHAPLILFFLPRPATLWSTNRWLLMAFVIMLIGISMALHVFVEKPMLRFLNRTILPGRNAKEKGGSLPAGE